MNNSVSTQKLSKILALLWSYTLLVILWGAWVRISHSGDGCGDHWPLCSGQFVPDFAQKKTWIEYAHRLMSGSYGIIILCVFYQIRKYANLPRTKNLAALLVLLMVTEALLGAVLVKGQLVTTNDSVSRLIVMTFHQLNSFLLTGITFLLFLALKNEPESFSIKSYKPFLFFILLAVSGAIASLSTTLFPSISLFEGIMQDFSGNSHLFVRLRILHPLLALTIAGSFVIWLFKNDHSRTAIEFLLAIVIGVITILTLSPVYLKLAHLLIAHLLWARLIYLFVNSPDSSNR